MLSFTEKLDFHRKCVKSVCILVAFDQNDRSLNVAIRDLPESVNGNLNSKVNALIKIGLNFRVVSVSQTERKESSVQSRPSVVIATFLCTDDKRKVMSEK